jgi:hypothetical protein
VGGWFGRPQAVGELTRRTCLPAALFSYFVLWLFTAFVFRKRRMSWAEVVRRRHMDTPLLSAIFQVVVGGALFFSPAD